MISKCCVDAPASDSLGPRVNHGAVRDNGYTGGRPTEVDDRRGARVAYLDAATQGRCQAIFYHANAANTCLFSGGEDRPLLNLGDPGQRAHNPPPAEIGKRAPRLTHKSCE